MRRIASASALALLSSAAFATTGMVTDATAATPPVINYVAMGDGFAGGEGAPATVTGFDDVNNSCHRASLAPPRLFATAKGLSLEATNGAKQTTTIAGHIACTDAGTAGIRSSATHGEPAQITQLGALTPKPALITLTVGATDARMREVMLACVTNTSCTTTLGGARTVARTSLITSLRTTYTQLKAAAPTARIVIVGYPRLYTATANPALCSDLTGTKLTELDGYARDLDAAAATAATAAGLEYVSMLNVLGGHELCTASPWVNAVAMDGAALNVRAGYPTATGQRAMASTLAAYLTRYPTAASARPNATPTAAFTYKRRSGTTNRVVLDGSASKDTDGFVRNWVWSSQGKALATGRTATISLGTAKTKVVTLTVIDNQGGRASVTRTVSARSSAPR
ncbi:MAG: GDSL-type esterase/lipase family protein [Kineosporiaceae bacterium]